MFPEIVDTLEKVQARLKRLSLAVPAGYWQAEALASADSLTPLIDGSVACCDHALHAGEIEGIRHLARSLPNFPKNDPNAPRPGTEAPLTDDDVEYDRNG